MISRAMEDVVLNESPWCSACQASGHPREAHSDPALARVEAHKAASRGDYAGATMWLRVAVTLRRKAAQQ